jgi:hypothetical protein
MRAGRGARLTFLVTLILVPLVWTLAWNGLRGQAAEFDNWVAIGSSASYVLTLSKDGDQVGSFNVPSGKDFVVAFNNGQPHSHDKDGNRFEFHGDFTIYPQPASYAYQGRFHPDKNPWQWASEGPVAISGHDMDLVITKVTR